MSEERKVYMGDFEELSEFFEGAFIRNHYHNPHLADEQKDEFLDVYIE